MPARRCPGELEPDDVDDFATNLGSVGQLEPVGEAGPDTHRTRQRRPVTSLETGGAGYVGSHVGHDLRGADQGV